VESLDKEPHEYARPEELIGACGVSPHRRRSKAFAPPRGIEFLLGVNGVFEWTIDVVHEATEFAHACTSNRARTRECSRLSQEA
jgi:hypothetical protein